MAVSATMEKYSYLSGITPKYMDLISTRNKIPAHALRLPLRKYNLQLAASDLILKICTTKDYLGKIV